MQVIEAIQEISKLSSEQSQDIAVTELSNELDEEVAHLLKEDVVVAAQSGERLLGNSNQQLFRVNL